MKKRGVSKRFLQEMRKKLEHGRNRGRTGWDEHWNCKFSMTPQGTHGLMMIGLRAEMAELEIAINKAQESLNPETLAAIRSEAADVANFAMMVADIHDAL